MQNLRKGSEEKMGKVKEHLVGSPGYRTYVVNAYYQWMCDIVHVNQEHRSYWMLIKTLHEKEFRWSVPNDDNRFEGGKDLRNKFAAESTNFISLECLEGPCTMLEMLISLAYSCEYNTVSETPPSVREWFWKMLCNTGLKKFTDEKYGETGTDGELINEILDRIIDRTYLLDGTGGLFPLKHPQKDQTKVELWYQMNAYIIENYM